MNTPASLPQAVLWDLDGTLIDSEPVWMAAEERLMAAHGVVWTHEDAMRMVGNALPVSAGLMQEAGLPMGNREIVDALLEAVVAELRGNVPWRPGSREMLLALRDAGVPQALVTMSEAPMAEAVIEGLGLNPFDTVVTGEMVSEGKPSPVPYLTALEELERLHPGLDRSRAIALEDSIPGTASAVAAGLTTVAVPLHVALPDSSGMHVLDDGLAGVTPQDLGALLP